MYEQKLALSLVTILMNGLNLLFLLFIWLCLVDSRVVTRSGAAFKGPLFLFIICTAQSLLLVVMGILAMGNFYTHASCQFVGMCITIISGALVVGHLSLAFERYCKIILLTDLTRAQLMMFSIPSFVILIAVGSTIMTHGQVGFVLMESEIYCFFNYTSSYSVDRVCSFVSLVYSILCINVIFMVYSAVYMKTRQAVKATASTLVKHQHGHELERKVFYKCLLTLVSFNMSYGPLFALFIYRAITLQHVPYWLDYSAGLLICMDDYLTPILVISMRKEWRDAVIQRLPSPLARSYHRMMEVIRLSSGSTPTAAMSGSAHEASVIVHST